jgi:hypothetical protein
MKLDRPFSSSFAGASAPVMAADAAKYNHKAKELFDAVKLTLVKRDFPAFRKLWDCSIHSAPDGEKAIRQFYDDAPKGGAAQLMELGSLKHDQDPVTYYAAVANAPPKFTAAFRLDALANMQVVWFGVLSIPF